METFIMFLLCKREHCSESVHLSFLTSRLGNTSCVHHATIQPSPPPCPPCVHLFLTSNLEQPIQPIRNCSLLHKRNGLLLGLYSYIFYRARVVYILPFYDVLTFISI